MALHRAYRRDVDWGDIDAPELPDLLRARRGRGGGRSGYNRPAAGQALPPGNRAGIPGASGYGKRNSGFLLGGMSSARLVLTTDETDTGDYTIVWDQCDWGGVDSAGDLFGEWWDPAQPTRLTVPDAYVSAGAYVRVTVAAQCNGVSHEYIQVRLNGSNLLAGSRACADVWSTGGAAGGPMSMQSRWVDPALNDYFEILILADDGASTASAYGAQGIGVTVVIEASVNANNQPTARYYPVHRACAYLAAAYNTSSNAAQIIALDTEYVDTDGMIDPGDLTTVNIVAGLPFIAADWVSLMRLGATFCRRQAALCVNWDGTNDGLEDDGISGYSAQTAGVASYNFGDPCPAPWTQLAEGDALNIIFRKQDTASDEIAVGAKLDVWAMATMEDQGDHDVAVVSVYNSGSVVTLNGSNEITSWDTKLIEDVSGVWDAGTPEDLVVPAGYNRARVTFMLNQDPGVAGAARWQVQYNGSAAGTAMTPGTYPQAGESRNGSSVRGIGPYICTGWVEVSPGDIFTARCLDTAANGVIEGVFQIELANV